MDDSSTIPSENSVNALALERFEREALRFSGHLLAEAEAVPDEDTDGSRLLKLALYETTEGDFVAGIILCTSAVGEQEVPVFERLDEVASVENFFFAFEPVELLRKAGVDLPSERLEQIATDLYKTYEVATREILAVMADRKEPQVDVVQNTEAKAPEASKPG